MKLTDKNTITSKDEPKSKTVTWIDMSTGSPVMRKFINGMWRPVGSGGGGGYTLPTATANRLGGVKIGSGITVDSAGTISVEGGSDSGCTCGIPTIDKDIQPNVVWRDPTAEDLEKFHSQRIEKVADLTEGKLPLFLVINEPYDDVDYVTMSIVASVEPPEDENDDIHVGLGIGGTVLMAEDWSLLGKEGVN